MLGECLEQVRTMTPLVHSITNYVTANDVANIILACGGSPIMSDEAEEAAEITAVCDGLYINIGTLHKKSIEAMFCASQRAAELQRPVLLDPVGVGASLLRTETALALLEKAHPAAIRGNISEIKALALGSRSTSGVDANAADAVTEETLGESMQFVKSLSQKTGAVIVVTGAIDLVADSNRCAVVRNGRPEMSKVTGTGCQLSGLMTAFVAANSESVFEACVAAVCAMGLAGELAYGHMQPEDGNATYRNRMIDAISHMNCEMLNGGARYEIK